MLFSLLEASVDQLLGRFRDLPVDRGDDLFGLCGFREITRPV